MNLSRRRRRGIAMLALAVACGGLAASDVEQRARRADERVGPLVQVAVARAQVRAGTRLTPALVEHAFAVRQAPAKFVPPDSLPAASEAAGGTLAVTLPAGSYLTAAALARGAGGADQRAAVRTGQRLVDLEVAAGPDLLASGPGSRVDVLLTTGGEGGHGRTYLALEDAELASIRSGAAESGGRGASDGAAARANAVASLRVDVRQAVFLTAAESFAREVRLLLRPPYERPRSGQAVAVTDSAL